MPMRDDAILDNLSPSAAVIQIQDDVFVEPTLGTKANLNYNNNRGRRTSSRFSKNILSSDAESVHEGPIKFAPV